MGVNVDRPDATLKQEAVKIMEKFDDKMDKGLPGFISPKVSGGLGALGMGALIAMPKGEETYLRTAESTPSVAEEKVKEVPKVSKEEIQKKGVPSKFSEAVITAADHIGTNVNKVINHLNAENGKDWNVNLRGHADPTDRGISQLNPVAVNILTGKTGPKVNYFKKHFGQNFDINNGEHQILGYSVYINWLKQFALPKAGVKNPTVEDAMIAYNTGAEGLAHVKNGTATSTEKDRYNRYYNLLKKHGVFSE